MIIDRLFTIRDQAERLRLELSALIEKEQSSYRGKLREEIELIGKELDSSKIPENFRIAVVGTFKTGKSSFVNKLADEPLAGVQTNPETAAITIFRYAETTKAEVSLISSDEWAKMEELYEKTPMHPDAYRVAGLRTFNAEMEKRKDKEGKSISFDSINPDFLVKEWLKQEGYKHEINAIDWNTKEGKQSFRKEIKQFTSSRNPLHYFVKELAVYAPVKLLRDHVELIDTPGLNDTQLYRGQLTEDLLSEVDAILFLTRSGASFSQYDKEFIVRQLRKKRLCHLRLIVTQVDTTFDAACHDAREEDEEEPTFAKVREKEEARLRSEIRQTLNELLDDSNLKEEDFYYYMEQLDTLRIHFTSVRWFDDGKIEDSGIPAVKEALFEVLSENYHLQQLVEHLERTIEAIKARLKSFFNERRSVMEADFDPKKVEASMVHIEKNLVLNLDGFESTMKSLNEAHDREQEALQELMSANVAHMQLMSRTVLTEFEKTDVARHWKSRRYGSWGDLKPLGEKVADKVFPVMESSLQRKIRPFNDFLSLASESLDGLESGIEKLEAQSAIEGLPKIEFSEAKERFMTSYVEDMKENVNKQKDEIVEFLENFATGELQTKLSGAKNDVADVWGRGTTLYQNSKVEDFYNDIGNSYEGVKISV
jgi:GTPase SAR1 family protein